MNLLALSLRITARLCMSGILLLQACVSYQPSILVPPLNMSVEDPGLISTNSASNSRLEFGLDLSLNESDSLTNIEVLPGVRVRNVTANGAADSAGIQLGDVILSINDTPTNHPDVVMALQQQSKAETAFNFKLRRNTVVLEATVIARLIAGNAAPQELYRIDPLATRAGYRTEMLTVRNQAELAAARVVELFPESPLAEAGINVGDLILSINGDQLNSAQDLITRLNQDFALGDRVTLGVYRSQSITQIPLRLWNPGRRISRIALGPLLQYESSLSPVSNRLSVLDFWLFSFYSYQRSGSERSHSLLGLINITSDLGELTEEEN